MELKGAFSKRARSRTNLNYLRMFYGHAETQIELKTVNAHPVIGWLNIRRQLSAQFFVVEVDVQVGDDCAARLHLADPS